MAVGRIRKKTKAKCLAIVNMQQMLIPLLCYSLTLRLQVPLENRRLNSCYLPILEKSFKGGHMHGTKKLKSGNGNPELPGGSTVDSSVLCWESSSLGGFVSQSENWRTCMLTGFLALHKVSEPRS